MTAEDESAYFLLDGQGNAEEVSQSEFQSSLKGDQNYDDESDYYGGDRFASRRRKANQKNPAVVITFSTDVNAVSQRTGNAFADVCTWCKNKLKSLINRNRTMMEISLDDIVQRNQDRSLRDYRLGFSLHRQRGVYHSDDANGEDRLFRENSYVLTIYGATRSEGRKMADEIKRKYEQESVVVNIYDDIPTEFR